MKKIFVTLLAVSLLTLCACSKDTVKVSEPDTVLISGKDNFTKQELFETMRGQDYSSILIGHLSEQLAVKEGVALEEMQASADEEIEFYKSVYGDYFAQLVQSYGGEENFKANIVRGIAGDKLTRLYVEKDFDSYVTEYVPVYAQMAYFENLNTANAVLEAVKNGADFAEEAANNGYSLSADPQVYTDKDESMNLTVKQFLNSVEGSGLSEVIPAVATTTDSTTDESKETARYYIVNVLDTDPNNFKEEFITTVSASLDNTEVMSYYFDKYDVTFYDQTSYDLLSATYTGLN